MLPRVLEEKEEDDEGESRQRDNQHFAPSNTENNAKPAKDSEAKNEKEAAKPAKRKAMRSFSTTGSSSAKIQEAMRIILNRTSIEEVVHSKQQEEKDFFLTKHNIKSSSGGSFMNDKGLGDIKSYRIHKHKSGSIESILFKC
jgi:hypothetical protein